MKRKVTLLVIIALSIAIGLGAFWRWASGPVESPIQANPPKETPMGTLQQIDTDYFYVHIPTDYRLDKESTTHGPTIRISATQQIAKGIQLGITSMTLPQGGLSEIADYHMRTTQNEAYNRATLLGLPEGTTTFISTTTEPLQITSFLQRNGRYASVTLSSYSSSKEVLTSRLKQIITDWNWK